MAGTPLDLAADTGAAGPDYSPAIQRLNAAVNDELGRGIIPGVSIALVDDQKTVFAGGFGLADRKTGAAATADTVYRAGSISKVLTAWSVMQLVEEGKLDIDAPVTKFVPEFRIRVPFENAKPITLRLLMSHRSGMIRESPVGSYFDDTEPGIERTIASVAECALVYLPESRTQYSNLGPTLAGLAVQRASGKPFDRFQQERIFAPAGMKSSAWYFKDCPRDKAATGYMRVADGKGGFDTIEAPRFDLGTIPAGNLYTTATDLAKFASVVLAEGRAGEKRLLRAQTVARMFEPQQPGQPRTFGLGFAVGEVRGHKTVSHNGAVYGFTSSLVVLPKEKIAVIVLCNEDIATGPLNRLTSAAVDVMLAAKLKEAIPVPQTFDVKPSDMAAFAGHYESESYWAELKVDRDHLVADVSSQRMVLTPRAADHFEASGRYVHASPFEFERDAAGKVTGFKALTQQFTRIDSAAAPPLPREWEKLLGSYGKPFIPQVISARHGRLYAMTENMFDYRMHPVDATSFRMPPGLYTDERIVFELGDDGTPTVLVLANVRMERYRAPDGRR